MNTIAIESASNSWALKRVVSGPLPDGWRGDGVLRVLLLWHDRAAQRRALAQLDDHRLDDIGLSHAQVAHGTAKPFWRA